MKKSLLFLIVLFVSVSLFSVGSNTISDATNISSLPFSDSGYTGNFTNTMGNNAPDVFYKITSTIQLTNLIISLDGSNFDSFLRVYASDQYTQLWYDDDTIGTNAVLSGLTFNADTTYYICVEGYSSNYGTYAISVSADQSGNINGPGSISNAVPANGASSVSINQDLYWSFGSDTDTYDLYFDTIYPPVNLVVADHAASATGSYNPGTMQSYTTYYWRVVSKNNGMAVVTNSDYNFTTVNVTPGAVTQTSPINNSENNPLNTQISWTFGANTYTYDLYFDNVNPPVTQVVTDGVAGSSGSYDPGPLEQNTTYYWRIISKNEFVETETTSNFSFTTIDMTPANTYSPIPANLVEDVDCNQELSWEFGAYSDYYDLYFDTVFPPVNLIISNNQVSGSGSYDPGELSAYTTYYWRVVTRNDISLIETTTDYSFKTSRMLPGNVTNASPANHEIYVPLQRTLSWTFGANTETYDLYIDTVNPPLSQVVFDAPAGAQGSTGTYEFTTDLSETTFYWSIVTKNHYTTQTTSWLYDFQTTLGTDYACIGNGNSTGCSLPIEPYYGYTYSQSIYHQSEIDIPGRLIDKVFYHYNQYSALTNSTQWTIYMGHTNLSSFGSTSSWIPSNQLTTVFSGTIPAIGADGWMEFNLPVPFEYNNIDNLVIAVDENQTAYGSSYEEFFCTDMEDYRSIYYYSDSTNPNPASPPTGTRSLYIPNTRLHFQSVPLVPTTLVTPADGATLRPLNGTIEWDSTDFALGYRLNFGTDYPPTNIVNDTDQSSNLSYAYTSLSGGTTYYWQVIPYYIDGDAVDCPIWSFTTTDVPPLAATLVSPTLNENYIPLNPILRWADGGLYPTGYKLYLGTDNPPTNVYQGLDLALNTQYQIPDELEYGTHYYWQIVPYNIFGETQNSPVWDFNVIGEGVTFIGDGTSIAYPLPINCYYGYNYSQSIYLQSEINRPNDMITKVAYYYAGGSTLNVSLNWTIYMGHTTSTSFSSPSDWVPLSQLTQVGISNISSVSGAPGWIEFNLTTPFIYNNTDNLVVAIDENGSSYNQSTDHFLSTLTSDARSIYYYNDTTNPSPSIPPNGTVVSAVPNIQLNFEPCVRMNEDTISTISKVVRGGVVASWTGNTNVAITVDETSLIFTPAPNWFGTESIELYDSASEFISSLSVIVSSVNDVPYVVNPLDEYVIESSEVIHLTDINTVFADIENEAITLSFGTTPNFSTVINPDFSADITPMPGFSGGEMLYLYGQDIQGGVGVDSLYVVVLDDYLATENFNHAGAPATNWTIEHIGTTTSGWTPVLISDDNYSMQVSNTLFATCNERLQSPVYDFGSIRDVNFSFDSDFLTTSGTTTGQFQYSINGGTWTTLQTHNSTTNIRSEINASALNYQSNVRVRFLYSASELGVNHWYIDNFMVSGIVDDIAIPPVTNLGVIPASPLSVTLSWDEYTDNQFSSYEIEIADNEYFANASFYNSASNPILGLRTTTSIVIPVTNTDTEWFFRMRSVFDEYAGDYSDFVSVYLSAAPSFQNTLSESVFVNDNFEVTVAADVIDNDAIVETTLQYRVDYNLNNVYDETWVDYIAPIRSSNNIRNIRNTVAMNIALTLSESGVYHYEFRGMDSYGHGYGYSGTSNEEGISDDWSFEYIYLPTVTGINHTLLSPTEIILDWNQFTGDRFNQFTIEYADNAEFTNSTFMDGATDSVLSDINTTQINIPGLTSETNWYFKMKVEYDSYSSAESRYDLYIPPLPKISNLTPEVVQYNNIQSAVVNCKITDSEAINLNTLQVRVDYNRNGVYDEPWVDYSSPIRSNSRMNTRQTRNDSIEVAVTVYPPDSGSYTYEYRVMSSLGYGYSGDTHEIGIADDWSFDFVYDYTAPENISVFAVVGVPGETSLTLGWLITSDTNFSHYEIYYSNTSGVTTDAMLWSTNEDPNMSNIGDVFSQTVISGLNPGTQYFFAIRAVDLAGNASAMSPETSAIMAGGAAPSAPVMLSLARIGNDMILNWNDVTTDVLDNPITVTGYLIYADINPYFVISPSTLIGTSTVSSYTHTNGALNSHMFYRVVAVVGGRSTISAYPRLFNLKSIDK